MDKEYSDFLRNKTKKISDGDLKEIHKELTNDITPFIRTHTIIKTHNPELADRLLEICIAGLIVTLTPNFDNALHIVNNIKKKIILEEKEFIKKNE